MTDTPDKPEPPPSGIARPLTYEELSEAERIYYDPRRRTPLPETIHEYDPFAAFDQQTERFHR
jgi:hypothetical protein